MTVVEKQVAVTTVAAMPGHADSKQVRSVTMPMRIVAGTVNSLLHNKSVVPVRENVIPKKDVRAIVPYVHKTRVDPMVCITLFLI